MTKAFWSIEHGNKPVIACAIHNGHKLTPQVASIITLVEKERLREEDPYTDILTEITESRIIVNMSRFEMDLNRPPEKAIYRKPEDAWGLDVWTDGLPESVARESMLYYNRFYREIYAFFRDIERKYGRFVVLDLHSYCHRRNGPDQPPAIAQENPDINVGTGTMDRSQWSNVVDRFICDLRKQSVNGQFLDVRENVRFRGGRFSQWIHETFPQSGCALAVEIKKIFMDEWTGELYGHIFSEIRNALKATLPGILEELDT